MLWLKSLYDVPPQEFWYRQDGKTFEASPLIGAVASKVADYRKGNNLPRQKERECLEDIILFTVERLGPRSEWVYETDLSVGALLPSAGIKGCSGCGAKL